MIVFEGRDAASKGGTIKAITERVSPRVFRTVALPAPSDREKTQLFMQRYIERFPAAGEVVIFGATLRYLPKYSPDLNPIELPYSKFKDHLRKAAERTVRGLYPHNSRLRAAARGSRMCQLLQACRL